MDESNKKIRNISLLHSLAKFQLLNKANEVIIIHAYTVIIYNSIYLSENSCDNFLLIIFFNKKMFKKHPLHIQTYTYEQQL